MQSDSIRPAFSISNLLSLNEPDRVIICLMSAKPTSQTPPYLPARLAAAVAERDFLSEIAQRVRQGLANRHVTQVFAELIDGPGSLDHSVLARLGFEPTVLDAFPNPSRNDGFKYRPSLEGFRLEARHAHKPLSGVRLQVPPFAGDMALGLKVVRDVMVGLPSFVPVVVLVSDTADREAVASLFQAWGPPGRDIRIVGHDTETVFARDNAIAGRLADDRPALLLPRSDIPGVPEGDHLDADKVTSDLGIAVARSSLFWEGGNLLCDGRTCFVGANTVALNCIRLGLDETQVISALSAEFGVPVVPLGDFEKARAAVLAADHQSISGYRMIAGQADFHLDLDLCLIGAPTSKGSPYAAIADTRVAKTLVDQVLAEEGLFSCHFIPPQSAKEMFVAALEETIDRRRPILESYKQSVSQAGYRTFSVPDIRLAEDLHALGAVATRFNYVNAVPFSNGEGKPSVLTLQYGIKALDAAAKNAFEEHGISVHFINDAPTTAHDLSRRLGGLRCAFAEMVF